MGNRQHGNSNTGAAQAAADPANNPAVSVTDANAGAAAASAAAAADGGDGALRPAETGDQAADLAALNAKFEALQAENDRLKAESETEAARLASEAEHLRAENERLRDAMVSGDPAEPREYDPEEMVEVRVKTPLSINPDPEAWRYVEQGPPPAVFALRAGLNVVPRWVADHWLVKGSAED